MVAKSSFKPDASDELELRAGSQYIVEKDCGDGWAFGHQAADAPGSPLSSLKGLFPMVITMPLSRIAIDISRCCFLQM